jgi:hypothetical protein
MTITFARSSHRFLTYICIALLGLPSMGCSSDSVPTDEISTFTLADHIDVHVLELKKALDENGHDPIVWPGKNLVPEIYQGLLRAPRGVVAGFSGNDFDRCRMVRQLLSAANISNRYLIANERCTLQALVEGKVVHVPTSPLEDHFPISGGEVATILPGEMEHAFEIIERHYSANGTPSDSVLGKMSLASLASGPVTLDFVADGSAKKIRIQITGEDRNDPTIWEGKPFTDLTRLDLVFRHHSPATTDKREHYRILFETGGSISNRTADVSEDIYSILFAANIVPPTYLGIETREWGSGSTAASSTVSDSATALYLRAIELAMESDQATWKAFANAETELEVAVLFDQPRITIASMERRSNDGTGSITPAYDLVTNPHTLFKKGDERPLQGEARRNNASKSFALEEDEISLEEIRAALGILDGLVETSELSIATGLSVLSATEIFIALLREEPNDHFSRMDFYRTSLKRLHEEGLTEEAVIFYDPTSKLEARVVLIGKELVLLLDAEEQVALAAVSGTNWQELKPVADGVVLGETDERGWPIELYFLSKGALSTFIPRIRHLESPQLALSTPSGTRIEGSGTYLGESFRMQAIARVFETTETADPLAKIDMADWHRVESKGLIVGSGTTENDTPTLSTSKPHFMQWGADKPSNPFYYSSPLWLGPAEIQSIRNNTKVSCYFVYKVNDAVSWKKVDLEVFTDSRMSLVVDGDTVGVETITATNKEGDHQITVSKNGLTRLVLAHKTPAGEGLVETIYTPRQWRLRGRVTSTRLAAQTKEGHTPLTVGVSQASIAQRAPTIALGTGWPDGSVDLKVPGTESKTTVGTISLLIDSSGSMEQPADATCKGSTCKTKIQVVSEAVATISQSTSAQVEIAVWQFPKTTGTECPQQIESAWKQNPRLAPTLDRTKTLDTSNYLTKAYLTGSTPLTGAVKAAIEAVKAETRGASRRLVILADGDNDCSEGLSSIVLPRDIEIHTIGVGIEAGGQAETELKDFATRGLGTYTRTTNGADLLSALTTVAQIPLLTAPPPDDMPVKIVAPYHLDKETVFPIDRDDIELTMDEDPQRADKPALITLDPDDSFPDDRFDLTDEAVARIIERRTYYPNRLFIIPDRMVDYGTIKATLGWMEVDVSTGETQMLTLDGLRGAVVYPLSGKIAGMFAGVDGAIGGFTKCLVASGNWSCGDTLQDIKNVICAEIHAFNEYSTIASAASLGFAQGNSDMFNTAFTLGNELVYAACGGEGVVAYAGWNTGGSILGAVVGIGFGGGALGWMAGSFFNYVWSEIPFSPS